MLNNLESTSVRIVKPLQPPFSYTGQTAPCSLPQRSHQVSLSAAPPTASSSSPAPGPSYVPTPDSAGLRMATIQEDTSSDSHQGEEGQSGDFTTAEACSSATRSSYEDLTEHNLSARERRRLQRQDHVDTKETECWEKSRAMFVWTWDVGSVLGNMQINATTSTFSFLLTYHRPRLLSKSPSHVVLNRI